MNRGRTRGDEGQKKVKSGPCLFFPHEVHQVHLVFRRRVEQIKLERAALPRIQGSQFSHVRRATPPSPSSSSSSFYTTQAEYTRVSLWRDPSSTFLSSSVNLSVSER